MSENTDELQKESQNLLLFIWRKRVIILIVTGIAFVASIVVSLFMTEMFKSTAIVFPTATSTVSFSEQRNAKASSMDFGEEEQAEQLLQILQSSRIRNRIVERFDLFKHYEIEPNDPNKNFKLAKEYDSHIQFSRTRYGSIVIDVSDRDRELAAVIANKIVDLIDTVKNEMIKERTIPAFEINQRKKKQLETEKEAILTEMDSLSRMGVVSIEGRANLFSAYNESKNPADRDFFKKQIDVNLLYGAKFDGLEMLRDEKIVKLTNFEDSYEQAESDANAEFNHKFVVEGAVVADKKDKPKRMIIVLLATLGTFFFVIFALLVKDRLSELRKLAQVQFVRQHTFIFLFSAVYIALSCYLVWIDQAYVSLVSIGLIAVYFAVFYSEWTYLGLAFLTPLSINIEEYTDSFGLFLPTEPLLFGLLILILMQQLNGQKLIPSYIWKHQIVWAAVFYLCWVFITSLSSEHPVTSFKFLLAKLWFIVPMLFFGPSVFKKKENVIRFIWLLCLGMVIAICYTLVMHASYNFGEKEGHWVMWPFYKDHTIYGAAVAFTTPLIFGLYFAKKHAPLMQVVIIGLIGIVLVGLYFSYTRAAWLSVIAAVGVLIVIKLKIRFIWLASFVALAGIVLIFTFDQLKMELGRVKSEHTTEKFGEKFSSAVNVTTDASNLERLNRWACAIDMFQERPFFGFGPGTYAFEYARFQQPENLTIISTNFGDLGNAHSEYLGPLAEMGIFGLLAMLFIVTAIFYKGVTLYNKWPEEDKEMKTLILTMILALVTYFVHGILNNYLDTDKAAVPIWGFCAAFIALEYMLSTAQPKALDSDK